MKRPETAKIRNIALVAHGTAGKTTLTEALLFCAGATTRLGRVEDGTTTTDFDEDEIRRKISISTALAWAEWKGHKLNLVDTPGFAAFLTDARNALRVVDGAVVVVGATDGVKVQTEKVWSAAASLELPRAVYLSKMDRERADFARAVEDVRKNLSASAIPVQVPIGQEAGFVGVVDLIRMRALRFTPDGNGKPTEEEVPATVRELAEGQRAALVEAVAEADDRLLEKYLESGELSENEVREGLIRGIREQKLFPILCGAPARNIGVTPLLDLLVEAFPSPLDRPPTTGTDAKGNAVRCEAKDGGPLDGPGLQDHRRPLRGQGHHVPDLLRYHDVRLVGPERGQGGQGANRATPAPPGQAADDDGGLGGRRSRSGGEAQGDGHR